MIFPVALLLITLGQTVDPAKKVYSHPPADFKFVCTAFRCPIDMGTSWVTIDEYNGKFMECHRPQDVIRDASNCYDIPHQHIPGGCKPRRGHTWFQDCVADRKERK